MTHHLLSIPAPAAFIRSNDHTHWRNRHALTLAWRTAAAWEAKRQHLPAFALGPVHITATIHREDKRRFDLDGITPTVKACIDGLRDAHVLDEDHSEVITELTLRNGGQWADAAIVLRIEPIEDAPHETPTVQGDDATPSRRTQNGKAAMTTRKRDQT